MTKNSFSLNFFLLIFIITGGLTHAAAKNSGNPDSLYIARNYDKFEYSIPMRDGIKLFTAVYVPKGKNEKYPIMLTRTPYSVAPYGTKNYPRQLGPSRLFTEGKFIFAYQDVRGRFMSEGVYVNMRPEIDNKKDSTDVDESSDTYDTIDWLVKNIKGNNGKVGMWGISYPGYYTACALINSHPALVAASPQAPIADWFWDDFHHHGAFFLPHAFNFFAVFGLPRHGLTKEWGPRFDHGTPDGYKFFLEDLGPLKNVNPKYYKDSVAFWNEIAAHPNYDEFWKARNLRPHLRNVKPAVMVVGGWFDAEDLFGEFNTYKTIEENNPGTYNIFVMGPWRHGGWARDDGSSLGNVWFGNNPPPSEFYQKNIEYPFFNYYLKGIGKPDLPEAYMFETGNNVWHKLKNWPPKNVKTQKLYFAGGGKLTEKLPGSSDGFDEFLSNIKKPVPYTETITTGMTREYMTDDQRFAARRPDVLVYQTDILTNDVTLAGETIANLFVSTTGSSADWVVKLIDVYPDNQKQFPNTPDNIKMGGYQQMVRSEVIRGRFRNSYEKPEPFIPGKIAKIKLPLQGVFHTFKKGHRIMVQVQSTWFPLVDLNPQKYVKNIFEANETDFISATHRVYHSKKNASYIQVGIWKGK